MSAPRLCMGLSLALALVLGACQGSASDTGDDVTVVNQSSVEVTFEYGSGSQLDASPNVLRVPCSLVRRGFRHGETYSVRIRSGTGSASDTVTVGATGLTDHTFVVAPNGTVAESEALWPVDRTPCAVDSRQTEGVASGRSRLRTSRPSG
jgi:hypothetical protein